MKLTKTNAQKITDHKIGDIGIYAWKMPSGSLLQDTEGNVLNIPSRKGDIQRAQTLQRYAEGILRENGREIAGNVVFVKSHRVTEEEYQMQVNEMMMGRTPDYGA